MCLLCEDEGWVCESHRDQPFAGPHACRCGGAGHPVPEVQSLKPRRSLPESAERLWAGCL